MNNFTTQVYELLLKNDTNFESAIKEVVRSNIELAINELLKSELTAVLEYERYERVESDNARNGYYMRDFNTSFGLLKLNIPRDRKNVFQSQIIGKYERHDNTTEETIMKLFQTGLTNDEISNIVEALYAKKYSKGTVSNITNHFIANVEKFKQRKIQSHYAVVYTDATYICLRRDSVAKEAIYIALGITPEGYKEILGYKIAPTESCDTWRELLLDLKQRGLEKVDLFCTDGLAGFTNVVEELFDSPKIQRCLIHVGRNISSKVRVKERKEVCDDFKKIYRQETKEAAENELNTFIEKWKKYPSIKNILTQNTYLFTFYSFPKEIWPSIYNTNMIESFNKQIKRKTKRKEQFPNEESMEKVLVSIFEDFNEKNMNRVHKGFGLVPSDTWN